MQQEKIQPLQQIHFAIGWMAGLFFQNLFP